MDASNEAAAGNFGVEVIELAKARRLSSRSFSSLSDSLNLSGEFVVNGKGESRLDTDDGLLDIRDKINSADAGITAQLLTVSSGDSRLILTADEVGVTVSLFKMRARPMCFRDSVSLQAMLVLRMTSSTVRVADNFLNLMKP